jgi:hypothetical protein
MKGKHKNLLVIFLSLNVAFSLLPASAFAEELVSTGVSASAEENSQETEKVNLEDEEQLEELTSEPEIQTSLGETRLSGLSLNVYRALKSRILSVADGTTTSTVFAIPWSELGVCTEYSKEDLGVNAIIQDGEFTQEAIDAYKNIITFDWRLVMDCLREDCPYELYWFDKTQGANYDLGGYNAIYDQSAQEYNKFVFAGDLTFDFAVSSAYAAGTVNESTGCYENTNPARISNAVKAAENAKAIVSSNAGLTSYQKLCAYKNIICSLVSYDYNAANTPGISYGDAWQLISVFDNDSSTNVVCEGYAKAFQYLCNLGGLTCYTVTGTIAGNMTGSHMWNIVTLDGKNYLVDVTNCDTGSSKEDEDLFLAGVSGSVNGCYILSTENTKITYRYDDDTKNLFGTEILTLSNKSY